MGLCQVQGILWIKAILRDLQCSRVKSTLWRKTSTHEKLQRIFQPTAALVKAL